MFKIGFKDKYKVIHVNNEIGSALVGGAGTYMNEIYKYHNEDTGFVYMNMGNPLDDFDADEYKQSGDIAIMHMQENSKLEHLDCDIIVIQFYEFAFCVTDELLKGKKLAYVIHSVPTPEPYISENPFGCNYDIRSKFEHLCEKADVLVCVSNAEKNKLSTIYPQYASKIRVVHNGISYDGIPKLNKNHKKSRKKFGYIGRTDYRKGILETIKAIKDMDAELHIACPKNDSAYLEKILLYIEAANMQDRVKFYGWCVGERKKHFFDSLDALIIPSLYEPFGYVALEGMCHGLPIISSNNGGLDEILEGYKYKYNPYLEGGLENAIRSFKDDSEEIIYEQQQILLKNLTRFNAREMAEKYDEIWENLINGDCI